MCGDSQVGRGVARRDRDVGHRRSGSVRHSPGDGAKNLLCAGWQVAGERERQNSGGHQGRSKERRFRATAFVS